MKRIFATLISLITLWSCSPRLVAPEVTARRHYLYGEGFEQDSLSLPLDWWRWFGDTTLNSLVERALDYNRNLYVAASRIEQARLNLAAVRSQFLPSLGVALSAEGDYERATKITQQYAAELTVAWEMPLFGRLKRTSEASRAEIGGAIWNYRGVALALSAEVATTYFTLLEYERDLWIATRTFELRKESAKLIDSLFYYGMTTGVEREQARSLVYAAEADIPRYRSAIEQTHLALNLLTGEPPLSISQIGVGQGLLLDTQPRAIDIGIPSDLLQRRPDIMQARYALDAAAAKAGLARANRFPSISLSVKGGIGATSIKDLTSSNPAVWRAALGLVQPLFNFSGLKRQEQVAVEQYNQAAYTYEQTVLEAFSDVEQTLSAIAATELETERNTELVISYRSILEMAYALYRNGMADYLDVIDAERTLYTAQMTLVELLASQYINYATLCKALGGGWTAP